MGSTGSGNFTDYSSTPGNGKQGGTSSEDPCSRAFSTKLEEVDRCEYFTNHRALPPVDEPVTIERRTRIAAISSTGEIIGYLPTTYNYLAQCITAGYSYAGRVSSTRSVPVLSVTVDIAPI